MEDVGDKKIANMMFLTVGLFFRTYSTYIFTFLDEKDDISYTPMSNEQQNKPSAHWWLESWKIAWENLFSEAHCWF